MLFQNDAFLFLSSQFSKNALYICEPPLRKVNSLRSTFKDFEQGFMIPVLSGCFECIKNKPNDDCSSLFRFSTIFLFFDYFSTIFRLFFDYFVFQLFRSSPVYMFSLQAFIKARKWKIKKKIKKTQFLLPRIHSFSVKDLSININISSKSSTL